MPIFDRKRPRRNPSNDGGSGTSELDLEAIREDVPEVDETLKDIDRALSEPMTEKPERGGCGCWGS